MKTRLPHVVIRASAGSGKTYQLSNRYLRLLALGESPESILAVTFTRKAAGEIFDRIALRLAQAAANEKKRGELAAAIETPDLTSERCIEMLAKLLRSLHRLRVGTLDSYFAKIAGGYALEFGLPPGWRVLEEHERKQLQNRTILAAVGGGETNELLTLLHLLSKGEAIRGIASLVRDTADSLYSAFRETTIEAWTRLKIPTETPESAIEELISALAAVPCEGKQLGSAVAKDCNKARAGDWEDFLGGGLAAKVAADDYTYYKKPIPAALTDRYEPLVKIATAKLIAQTARQTEASFRLLSAYREEYRKLQQREARLGFDDVAFAIAESSEVSEARTDFRLDAAAKHLLLDEFQDTAPVQWRVLRTTAERIVNSSEGTFFCVGDVKQAIYGWRGGSAELFESVETTLPNMERVPLNTSYRSSQSVIDFVNLTFERLENHSNLEDYSSGVKKWRDRFERHETARSDLAGYVSAEFVPQPDDEADAEDAVERFTVERVAQAHARRPHASIGILTRTNAAVGKIAYMLRERGIPASEEGGNPLHDSAAVELVLARLRFADHPGDSASAFHLFHSPQGVEFGWASHRDAVRIARTAQHWRRELITRGYGPTVRTWSEEISQSCGRRDRSRLQQLIDAAYEWGGQATLRPRDFLKFLDDRRTADPTGAKIRVMTIHQAKGLEFDIVVLPELDKLFAGQAPNYVIERLAPDAPIATVCRYASETTRRFLPKRFQKMFEASLDLRIGESLCNLYVGLTRAVHELILPLKWVRENEKNLPKTYAGLLRAAIGGNHGPTTGQLYAAGDPDWQLPHEATTSAVPKIKTAVTQLTFAGGGTSSLRGLTFESPSSREGSASRQEIHLAPLLSTGAIAMQRGTAFHAWFELVEWLDSGVPSEALCLAVARKNEELRALDAETLKAWYVEFHEACRRGDTAKYLSRSAYAEQELRVENERSFAVSIAGKMLQGRIDRAVVKLHGDAIIGIELLDYKTDTISEQPGETLEARTEFYRPQLEAYREATAKRLSLPLSAVGAVLLFTGPGIAVRLA